MCINILPLEIGNANNVTVFLICNTCIFYTVTILFDSSFVWINGDKCVLKGRLSTETSS